MHVAKPSKKAQSDNFSDEHICECSQHKHLLWQCHLNSADSRQGETHQHVCEHSWHMQLL